MKLSLRSLRSTFPFALAVTGLASAAVTRDAHACSPLQCTTASAAPAASSTVPANAPAFPFELSSRDDRSVGAAPVLRDASGVLVSSHVLGQLLVPDASLAPGATYTLTLDELCTALPDAGHEARTQSFTTAAEAPLPSAVGTVSATTAGGRVEVSTSRGSCTLTVDAAVAKLSLAPSAAVAAFAAITQFETFVDGASWATSRYGSFGAGSAYLLRHANVVFAQCGDRNAGDDSGVTLGHHVIEVRAHVAGAAADPPPARIEVDLACATADGSALSDAAAPAVSIAPTPPTTPPTACVLARAAPGLAAGSGPSGWGPAWAALALTLLRRVRRKPHA